MPRFKDNIYFCRYDPNTSQSWLMNSQLSDWFTAYRLSLEVFKSFSGKQTFCPKICQKIQQLQPFVLELW